MTLFQRIAIFVWTAAVLSGTACWPVDQPVRVEPAEANRNLVNTADPALPQLAGK